MLKDHIFTLKNLHERFPTDDACLQFIWDQRFPNVQCHYCKRTGQFHKHPTAARWVCNCGRVSIHPKKGTIFQGSSTDLTKWFLAIYLVANSRNGVSARELMRQIGVTYKTAWRMLRLIRQTITKKSQVTVPADKNSLKRRIHSTHHTISNKNFAQYLAEFQYRSKHWDSDRDLFFLLLSMIVTRPFGSR